MKRKLVYHVASILILCTGCTSAKQKINQIYEPVFVGRPTENAFNGLVQMPDGELRHYGFEGPWTDPTHYVYISSHDNGLTWRRHVIKDPDLFTNENMPPPAHNPNNGDFLRIISTADGTFAMISKKGFDGPYQKIHISSDHYHMIRQPVFLKAKRRILITCGRSLMQNGIEIMQAAVIYSDDDGQTWQISNIPVGPRFETAYPHQKSRWQNYAIEPTVIELADGRIWMLLRTSMDRLYESFSRDHGAAWSQPVPSRFYATLTMPTLFRLKDDRLLLFHCNTTPMPEEDRSTDTTLREEQKSGLWDDVFTNRDAIHAAISDDEGATWKGFRELYLNPLRNEGDFATRGGKVLSLDKSVHQSQAAELPNGKVLLAFGQHPLVRGMIIFDPDWLYEIIRSDSFKNGLADWSTHRYIEGIRGHCAYNRDPGPSLIDHPDVQGCQVLRLRHLIDERLVCDVDGAVWNFPAALEGTFITRIRLNPGGLGGRISLIDRWFNPTDTLAHRYAVFTIRFDGMGRIGNRACLQTGEWVEIEFEWDDLQAGSCRLYINGKPFAKVIPLNMPSVNGINYVHFQSVADMEDTEGFLIESVSAKVNNH